jgi:DNA-binding transcriptional ArsR family regulator
LADPTRRRILDLLRERELTVSELLDHFEMSQPALSQHLRVLRDARLVRCRQQGRQRLYQLTPAPLRQVSRWVSHYEVFWDRRLAALGRLLHRDS